jgi:hypothetical protein
VHFPWRTLHFRCALPRPPRFGMADAIHSLNSDPLLAWTFIREGKCASAAALLDLSFPDGTDGLGYSEHATLLRPCC